ncbi:LLM class flavin-dependent oxidoreductase [Nocardia alba]|uniref:Alkanesulfonate monooxygenase SsuD/methylene tetrahydromethanopterin reductase-like flavin-dependent oxidoreductase (Luciferase family) n=1 Tax=Nocardia alba TaxID=225051 RepID=A0A4R1FBJ9_9NOCA|nr:LLM class flavin-dependent oxidoreductase [Nocardia alba]TCJ90154.1 alkanesulfonate monooxygenase SsuD/methylene tetrahydromethanopterin reductase-like flavin-dependent oxidoreductase (luciferase family) [Nocardia alba]
MSKPRLFLGIETVGTGTHPASWRRADSGAEDLFTAHYWTAVVSSAEESGFDAVFLPDSFAVQSGGAAVTRGRLDAVAIAARAAPLTSRVGLIPQVSVTHTEPFHTSKAVSALDFASLGRAGWEVTVSTTDAEAKAFGRKESQGPKSLWHEADEAIEVVTRLWDSWEDGAEIRDVPTGRFIDRDRLHYIDFAGDNFSVKGPAITPRSPQGQPIVTVRAEGPESTEVAVRRADLIRIDAPDLPTAAAHREALRAAIATEGRDPDTVAILLNLAVHLADSTDTAWSGVHELERWAPDHPPLGPDRFHHVGTAAALDDLLAEITRADAVDGVVLRPLALRASLIELTTHRTALAPTATTLRERLGLARPLSRYATTGAAR